jgi:hypothetical protein
MLFSYRWVPLDGSAPAWSQRVGTDRLRQRAARPHGENAPDIQARALDGGLGYQRTTGEEGESTRDRR